MHLFRSTHLLSRRVLVTWIAAWGMIGAAASACSIPVFRYALERWDSDRYQVIVYYRGELEPHAGAALQRLEERSSPEDSSLNIEVIRYDLAGPAPKLLDVQHPEADSELPVMEVRSRGRTTDWVRRWRGKLSDAMEEPGLFDSPVRRELVRRLLAGDSAVWLLIVPQQDMANELAQSLQKELNRAADELPLPEGIGLPGSELFSPVPLEVRFSVLAIARTDSAEQRFLELLAPSPESWEMDQSYVVPVFGRGRALDVIPHADLDPDTIDEIAGFICGACSCQVKQANPGFDLLVSANWQERLFGAVIPESSEHQGAHPDFGQPIAAEEELSNREVEYAPIPHGSKSGRQTAEAAKSSATQSRTATGKPAAVVMDGGSTATSPAQSERGAAIAGNRTPAFRVTRALGVLGALALLVAALTIWSRTK